MVRCCPPFNPLQVHVPRYSAFGAVRAPQHRHKHTHPHAHARTCALARTHKHTRTLVNQVPVEGQVGAVRELVQAQVPDVAHPQVLQTDRLRIRPDDVLHFVRLHVLVAALRMGAQGGGAALARVCPRTSLSGQGALRCWVLPDR